MWINFDQLLDLPNVTVVNYQKIAQTIFLKLALLNETIECPNCHQTLDRINQTEYNIVRDLSILGNRVYLEVPRSPPCPLGLFHSPIRISKVKAITVLVK
jgi:hypothetical protein